nr:methionine aminotransferase [Chitinophagaceae bacterium]
PSFGSYFECYSYRGLSEMNDKDFAIFLTKNYGVATIPVSAFYKEGNDNQVIRFCFVKQNKTLEKAVEQLKKFKA